MFKSDKYLTSPINDTTKSSVRLGLIEHSGSNEISLFIDGTNIGSLSPNDTKRLIELLQDGSSETTAEAFKAHHFLS